MSSNNTPDRLEVIDPDNVEEAIATAQRATSDPAAARALWELLLAGHVSDERFRTALQWILESVLVDLINNRIVGDDEFALVIGRRIATLLEQMLPVQHEQRVCAA